MNHITIAFYGQFRPVHAEGENLDDCLGIMRDKLHGAPLDILEKLYRDFRRQRKAGINVVSACHEAGGIAVSIREYPRDSWLDSLTDKMPVSPYERGEQ
jgi:hypothetical protein